MQVTWLRKCHGRYVYLYNVRTNCDKSCATNLAAKVPRSLTVTSHDPMFDVVESERHIPEGVCMYVCMSARMYMDD